LAIFSVTEVGVVGEVAIGWGLGMAPNVIVEVEPLRWAGGAADATAGHQWGPLVASQVRPVEALSLGGLELPVAVNAYTGGLPDWPARLVYTLTGSLGLVTALHVALGALFIALIHRFLLFHGTPLAATLAALVLATDWGFVFYRKVLGGTELLLLAGVLLTWWALWSRRWAAGRHGLLALGVGIGFGLLSKLTFVLSLGALLGAALATRWDRPRLRPPAPKKLWRPVAAVILLTAPLWLTWLHHALAIPTEGQLRSHDFPDLQLQRVFTALDGGKSPARETLTNLGLWLGNPLGFLELAYDATGAPGWSPWRIVGWCLVMLGVGLGWRTRHPTPQDALLRFTTVFLILQVGLIWLVARDLHHLAVATPTAAVLAGLALDQAAGLTAPRRSLRRLRNGVLLALPWMAAGTAWLLRTDGVVRSISVPTFTASGQAAIGALLEEHDVERVTVADYESYGMLELIAPGVQVDHAWAVVASERGAALPAILDHAAGGHLLTLEASAPMVYNLRPSAQKLDLAAAERGHTATRVAALPDDAAVLYRVD